MLFRCWNSHLARATKENVLWQYIKAAVDAVVARGANMLSPFWSLVLTEVVVRRDFHSELTFTAGEKLTPSRKLDQQGSYRLRLLHSSLRLRIALCASPFTDVRRELLLTKKELVENQQWQAIHAFRYISVRQNREICFCLDSKAFAAFKHNSYDLNDLKS